MIDASGVGWGTKRQKEEVSVKISLSLPFALPLPPRKEKTPSPDFISPPSPCLALQRLPLCPPSPTSQQSLPSFLPTAKQTASMSLANAMLRNTAKHGHRAQAGKRRQKLEEASNIYVTEIAGSADQWKPLVETFDTNGSGVLEREQVSQLLKVWNKGQEPTDAQLDFIVTVSDKNKDGAIHMDDIGKAAGTWMALLADQTYINELMDKYDTSKTGNLNKQELKDMMTDLNGEIEPTEEEIDALMKRADTAKTGVINRYEVRQAVECWYAQAAMINHMKEESAKKTESDGGGCCSVS